MSIPPDMPIPSGPSVDRLWQVIIALGTGLSTIVAVAIGHLHTRINALQNRVEVDRNNVEDRRSSEMRELRNEFKRQNEQSAEWRGKMADETKSLAVAIANMPTREELRNMIYPEMYHRPGRPSAVES